MALIPTKSERPKDFMRAQVNFPPLLLVLLPIVCGSVLAYSFSLEVAGKPLLFALAILSLWFIAWLNQRHTTLLARIFILFSLTILSIGYFNYRTSPSIATTSQFPAREITAEIQLEKILYQRDDKDYNYISAIGILKKSSHHTNDLFEKKKVYLSLRYPLTDALLPSSCLLLKGIIEPLQKDDAFLDYLLRQNVSYKLFRTKLVKHTAPPRTLEKLRYKAKKQLENILKKGSKNWHSETGVYLSMVLGSKEALQQNQKEAYKRTGSLHLFAISGLHVGVIASFLAFSLRWFRLNSYLNASLGLLLILVYVYVTGAAPSAVRAYLLVLFYWGGRILFRKKDLFSALLASALITYVYDPLQIFDIGFELSYCVVASIVLMGLPLCENLSNWTKKHELKKETKKSKQIRRNILYFASGTFLISLAANLASFPLTIYYFNLATPLALLLSILLIPLAAFTLILGFLSLMTSLLFIPYLPYGLNQIAFLTIKGMNLLVTWGSKYDALVWHLQFRSSTVPFIYLTIFIAYLIFCHTKAHYLKSKYFYLLPIGAACLVLWLFT